MPDLDLATADGPRRVAQLLHGARPLMIDLGAPGLDIAPWAERVQQIDARYDGHVAWTGDAGEPALADALTRWFGAPTTA
jgi:hypothetical protein